MSAIWLEGKQKAASLIKFVLYLLFLVFWKGIHRNLGLAVFGEDLPKNIKFLKIQETKTLPYQ